MFKVECSKCGNTDVFFQSEGYNSENIINNSQDKIYIDVCDGMVSIKCTCGHEIFENCYLTHD